MAPKNASLRFVLRRIAISYSNSSGAEILGRNAASGPSCSMTRKDAAAFDRIAQTKTFVSRTTESRIDEWDENQSLCEAKHASFHAMMNPPRKIITPRRAVLLGVVVLFALVFTQWRGAITRNRSIPDEPFQIAGNLYYVGHTGVTAFLLTGPEGHVLIDGGYPEHGPLIVESIARLGFDVADVRVLLNSHPHSDHAGGLHALQEASGAELWVSEGDAAVMSAGGRGDLALGPARFLWFLGALRFSAPSVDHTFADGETIRLGPTELTAHVTAGHTRGCTSWAFPVTVQQDTLLAVSICSLTLFPFVPLNSHAYPEMRADYERSLETLRSLPADIFLGSHTSWFSLHQKHRAQAKSASLAEPFIDPEGYRAFVDRAERVYLDRVSRQ